MNNSASTTDEFSSFNVFNERNSFGGFYEVPNLARQLDP